MMCSHSLTDIDYDGQHKILMSVILSTGGGCLPQCMLGYTHPQADTPLGRHPPFGRHPPPRQTPPGRHPLPPAVTAADGTHPTGMHSCVEVFILHWDRDWRWPPLGAVFDFYRMLLFLSISEQVIFFFRLFYSSRKKIAPKRWLLLQHTCSFIRRQIRFV